MFCQSNNGTALQYVELVHIHISNKGNGYNEKRRCEFEERARRVIWESFEGGKEDRNDVSILKFQKIKNINNKVKSKDKFKKQYPLYMAQKIINLYFLNSYVSCSLI